MKIEHLIKSVVGRATSMNQAAKRAKIAQSTLSEWCSGKVSPGLERYIDLCRALGCRPGWELDQFLGLSGVKPQTAEDLLGMALSLSPIEQQRLISLLSAKYAEFLEVKAMIDIDCLIDLITQHLQTNQITPEKFIKKSGLTESQYLNIMHGMLVGSVEDVEAQLTLIASTIKNPTTGETFSSRDEMINYCNVKKSNHTEVHEPNGTNHR